MVKVSRRLTKGASADAGVQLCTRAQSAHTEDLPLSISTTAPATLPALFRGEQASRGSAMSRG